MFAGVHISTTTSHFSDRALLHSITTEHNPTSKDRMISLVWRKTATSRRSLGVRNLPTFQRFAHWGLEITTLDQDDDGYVWELRLDPENPEVGDLLASAASVDRWRGDGVGRASTGIVVNMTDAQIQVLAMSIAVSMRRPMLKGLDVELFYDEYKNNCQKFARSLAVGLLRDVGLQKQMRAFFARQSGFGNKLNDPAIAPGEDGSWVNSDAY